MEAEPAPRWEVPTPGAPLRLSLLHGLFVLCCERTNTSGSSASFAGTGESLGASPARRGDTLISQSLPRLDPPGRTCRTLQRHPPAFLDVVLPQPVSRLSLGIPDLCAPSRSPHSALCSQSTWTERQDPTVKVPPEAARVAPRGEASAASTAGLKVTRGAGSAGKLVLVLCPWALKRRPLSSHPLHSTLALLPVKTRS